jgi:CBS domain containing-hemolysin-like protein
MTGLGLLIVGTMLGGLGTMAAASIVAVNRMELYRWIAGSLPGARAARSLLASPQRTLGAALGLSSVGVLFAGAGLRALLSSMSIELLAVTVLFIAVPLLVTVAYTFPRAAGRRWPESVIKGVVPMATRLAPILNPVLPHEATVRPRSNVARKRTESDKPETSDTEELGLVTGVMAFTERTVREVMTPRTEVVAVREGAPTAEIGRVFAESGYSRIPVYRDSLDHIEGMFYAFDLLRLLPGAELGVRPVTMTPASRPCADLLFEMQRDRRQLAVVLDEYGGTAGIATLQDLLEELVDEAFETSSGQGSVALETSEVVDVPGTGPADEIAERFGVELPTGAETIGGLLMRAAGRIPRAGERYQLAGLEFYVLSATATRIERIAVRRGPAPEVCLTLEPKK